MQEHTLVSHLGLLDREVSVIRSVFKLVPDLSKRFEFVETDKAVSANLLLVNADDAGSMDRWKQLSSDNAMLRSIMVSSVDEIAESEIVIKRPLIMKRLIDALEQVITTKPVNTRQSARSEKSKPAGVGAKKVLVVDDSFPVREFMKQKLRDLSAEPLDISFAASGAEAMELVKEESHDLIFLDVVMPGVDGYKVCKWIKSVRPRNTVVMLTSKKSPFDKVRGAMSGCDAYITKPPSDERLSKYL